MKIIHIVLGRANPNRMNGVNRVVHNLATAQTSKGIDVTVWGITASANLSNDELDRSYKTKWFLPSSWSFGVTSKLRNALKTEKNTIFHLHGGFIPVFYSLSRTLKHAGIKHYLTPHGTYTSGAMQGNGLIKKWYFYFLEKGLISRLNGIQCLGHCEASDLKKMSIKTKISVIPNGQNWNELKTNLKSIPNHEFIIGYCGRISKYQKGMDILMEAFGIYKTKLNGKGKLHLIGDGDYSEEMKENANNLNLKSEVTFHGSKFGRDKINLLKSMTVFVHTSRNEGLPTAVIEALALGVPCLVTEMTSMDRYVEEYNAGWALPSLNPKEIAQYFMTSEKAYEAGELKTLGNNAKKLALEAFDWNIIAEQTFVMYAA